MMKRETLLTVLILLSVALVAIADYPKWPEIQSPPGAQWLWDSASNTWRPRAGDGLGGAKSSSETSSGATATILIPLPAIGLATRSITLLATNSVTLLSSLASFTDRDVLFFQPRGKIYWSVLSGTTQTAAQMQAGAFSMEAGDTPVILRLMTTANLAFCADSAAPATLTYTLGREQ